MAPKIPNVAIVGCIFLPLPFALEEVVVPIVRLGTVPSSLLASLLDVVEDELATGVGEGTVLAGLVVAARVSTAGVGSSAGTGVGSSGIGRGRRAGHGAGHGAGRSAGCLVI